MSCLVLNLFQTKRNSSGNDHMQKKNPNITTWSIDKKKQSLWYAYHSSVVAIIRSNMKS